VYDYQFPDSYQTAFVQLRQTSSAIYKLAERKLAKIGLTPIKVYVLWLCREYDGPLTPAEISRSLFRESQTIAGLLARMEKEGLVRRIPKRKGHPFTEVQITEKGKEAWYKGVKVAMAVAEDTMSPLPAEELEQLGELLRKLRQKALGELREELMPQPDWAYGRV
jgi:MarR family transcriptional regulator for hemolysin